MQFEDVMKTVNRWMVATEALAAVGAELTLMHAPETDQAELVRALESISAAAGLRDLATLPPPQRQMLIGLIRLCLYQSVDVVDHADRAPGWTFTDPAILEGWGRGSTLIPAALKSSAPELADVREFLDVGTGVGLLAIAAAGVWPNARVVGLDVWAPSLEAARANIGKAGLGERITIREQNIVDLDDVERYDCIWLPTFFLSEGVLRTAMPAVVRALQPGGTLVLGRLVLPPDPLAAATFALRIVRSGGVTLESSDLCAILKRAGCTGIRQLPAQGPSPLEYVVGQRPS